MRLTAVVVFAAAAAVSQLDVAAQGRRIEVIEQIQAAQDMVVFPEGTSGFILTGIGTEFAHDNMLGGRFERQGHDNPLESVQSKIDKNNA